MKIRIWLLALIALLSLATRASDALASDCVLVKARPVLHSWSGHTADGRYYLIEGVRADSRGGMVKYHIIGTEQCAGRIQRFQFEWTFDKDLSAFQTPERGVAFHLRMTASGDRDPCINANAQYMSITQEGRMFGWSPSNENRYWAHEGPGRLQIPFREFGIDASNHQEWSGTHGFRFDFALPSLPNHGGDWLRVTYHFDVKACGDTLPPRVSTGFQQQACDQYAKGAIQQNQLNLDRRCGYTGGRWQSDYGNHYGWCMSVEASATDAEARAREAELARCAQRPPVPPSGPGARVVLGGVDLLRYCRALYGASAAVRLEDRTVNGWRCVSGRALMPISVEDACRRQYADPGATARYVNFNDPNSWQCAGASAGAVSPPAPPVTQPPAVIHNPPPDALRYLGCYKDQGDSGGTSGRDLSGSFTSNPKLTVETCLATCTSRGFAFAGVQYGSQCFCGHAYGRTGVASNCNMPCSGNARQVCGGSWANSVYATSPKLLRR